MHTPFPSTLTQMLPLSKQEHNEGMSTIAQDLIYWPWYVITVALISWNDMVGDPCIDVSVQRGYHT